MVNRPQTIWIAFENLALTVYSFEFAQSYFRPIRIQDWYAQSWIPPPSFLCRLQSIATHRDHFVRRPSVCLSVRLSVRPSVCLSVCHTFLSHFPKLCFAGDTCIPWNAATIFSYIILYKYFNLPSFKFALKPEGEKGENKTGRNFPCIQYVLQCQALFKYPIHYFRPQHMLYHWRKSPKTKTSPGGLYL